MIKTVCFTGHRPHKLGGYDDNNPIAQSVIKRLEKTVEYLIKRGVTTFITGMALGVDTWGAKAVLKNKEEHSNIKLIAAIPFKGQESRWYEESVRTYNEILSLVDEKVIVSSGGFSGAKMQIRNEYMVDNSGIVLAVWDGDKRGGTYNCVRYAERVEHSPKIININPNNDRIVWVKK